MWVFLMTVCLLDQNQAAPFPWERSSLQPALQQQLDQTAPSAAPDVGQQKTSSSSSSSSSVSSESSQSSESRQQLREQQQLENTAVEQMDSSQESSPSSTISGLWLNELVSVGERAAARRRRRRGDDSVASRESRPRALMTSLHLRGRPRGLRLAAGEAAAGPGGAVTARGGAEREEGGVTGEEIDAEFPRLPGGLTLDSPGRAHLHGYHGNEAGLELGL
ncbi:uncharacterized protein LOC122870287 [Siniperca chuatsi]|uniref:uncharacterized protein LOC122870287 n=1 Tax=Siniperca chuatsi TaxID=119488 RepID=UPI001CE1F53C|nr:uncharacterized protein LOC122870287 [Siniperca chuatsi]